ncbi:XRE family transcriptional regulator [Dyadobacter sandarakinus]|nr:XRE family transcriptional regulator [Dyadobacter sandarakinus]
MNISGAKMSKVISGHQFLSAEAIGLLIKEFNIHPNWLFGFEGNDDEIIYMSSPNADSELAKRDKEIQDLKLELGEVYKQLAEERRKK